jgi:hypothetical protein
MLTSFLLRLRADRLAVGEYVGELEPIATGDRCVFRDLGELLDRLNDAVREAGADDADSTPEPAG